MNRPSPPPRTYKSRVVHEKQKLWMMSEVDRAQATGFFGTLSVTFEGGVMKRLRVEESKLAPH